MHHVTGTSGQQQRGNDQQQDRAHIGRLSQTDLRGLNCAHSFPENGNSYACLQVRSMPIQAAQAVDIELHAIMQ